MKVYRADHNDTLLAKADPVFMQRVCDCMQIRGVEVIENPDEADFIVLNESQLVAKSSYLKEILKDSFVSQFLHKIIVVNWADNANGILRGIYTGLRESRRDHKRHRVVPYFKYPNELVLQNHNEEMPQYLASFRGNIASHPIRKKLFKYYHGHPDIFYQTTESWFDHKNDEKRAYVNLITNSKFVLCPGGNSPTSYRLQEVMALGRCPVIISDDYPKKVEFYNPLKHAIIVPESDIKYLEPILKEREKEWKTLGVQARKEWEKIDPAFTYEKHADLFIQMFKELAPISLADSKQFLQSYAFRKKASLDIISRILLKLNRQ